MRNAIIDPQPGDKFRNAVGDILTVEERRVKLPNEHIYGLGTAKCFITYRSAQHRGVVFTLAVSGIKRQGWEIA